MNVDSEALIGFVAVPLSLPCTCVPVAVVSMYDGSPMALDLLPFTSLPVPIEMDFSPDALAPDPIAIEFAASTEAFLPIAIDSSALVIVESLPTTTESLDSVIIERFPII